MRLSHVLGVVLVAVALWSVWRRLELRPIHPPDGVLAPAEPRQSDLQDASPLQRGRWRLTPRADYDVTARILAREDYYFDTLADLVPEDLALGWGPMSDNAVLTHFDISQDARFYFWQSRGPLVIAREAVTRHSANTHLIPANDAVRAALKRLRIGEVVHLSGELVDGQRSDGAWIKTSLSRSDSGPGSCEVLLVEAVAVQ
jgi:hypothetical protein